MQLKKSAAKIIIWTVAIALVLSGAVCSYADEYWEVRNGDISFALPDGWTCNEIEEDISDDMECEQVAEACDEGGSSLSMDLYYADDDVDEYEWIYFRSNKDDAMEYFDKYGKAAVQSLYEESVWAGELSIGEPELYDADYNTFLTVPVGVRADSGEEFSDVVYLACDMTNDGEEVIHKMLRFYNSDGSPVTENQQETISLIADGFYDRGYGDDSSGYYDDNDYGSDFSDVLDVIIGVITLMLPAVIIILVIVKKARKKGVSSSGGFGNKNRNRQRSRKGWNRTSDDAGAQKTVRRDDFSAGFRRKQREDSDSRFRQKNSSFGEKRSRVAEGGLHRQQEHPHDHIRPSNADERYMDSLLTLRKSGLLTKEEMQDMLERHERNMMHRR